MDDRQPPDEPRAPAPDTHAIPASGDAADPRSRPVSSYRTVIYTGADHHPDLPYLPTSELISVVNQALFIRARPLLLRGDPGTGKSSLAAAVAYELGLPLESWVVNSRTRIQEGLYTYHATEALREAQLAAPTADYDPRAFVTFGLIGRLFMQDRPAVLVVDDIDRADPDFVLDLLTILREQRFSVLETGQVVAAGTVPLVVFTASEERPLPRAVLRRCLVYRIPFPTADHLVQILNAYFPDTDPAQARRVVQSFLRVRTLVRQRTQGQDPGPGIDTLLTWFQVLGAAPDGARDQLETWAQLNHSDPQLVPALPFGHALLGASYDEVALAQELHNTVYAGGSEPLVGRQLEELSQALMQAFPSRSELAMLVSFRLEENLNAIAEGDNLQVTVFKLVQWAVRENRVAALIQGALALNRQNVVLQQLAERLVGREG